MSSGAMAEDTGIVEPKAAGFIIKGRLAGSFSAIASRLSTLQMFSIKVNPDSVVMLTVESRDMQKNPFLFFIFTFKADEIEVRYTIPLDSSEKMRKLYIIKNLLSVLSLIADLYQPDQSALYQLTDSIIDDVLNSLSQSYSSLFNSYDSLFNEYRELKRLNIELSNSNKSLTAQATQLASENNELKARLDALEKYSDEALMVMVEDLLEAHSNTIDISEFARTYKLTIPRIEQLLNKMVTLGYVELKG